MPWSKSCMESLEAHLLPLLVEKTHPLPRIPIAGGRSRSGTRPICRPVWDILQLQLESFCAAFRLREDDPAAERGMLGSQQTQDGAASKESVLFKAVCRAHERKGHQLNICPSNPTLFWIGGFIIFAHFCLSGPVAASWIASWFAHDLQLF